MTELKDGEKETPSEAAQPEQKPEDNRSNEEQIDLEVKVAQLEEQLSKELEEKENYKKGVLSKEEELKKLKTRLREINDSPPEQQPTQPSKAEGTPDKSSEPNNAVPSEPKKDDTKIQTEGYNPEKEAIAQFKRKYSSINMSNVLEHYRGGKFDTVTEYLEALEDAKGYYDWKTGSSDSSSSLTQGGGVSEVENKSHTKVTARDIQLAKKFFDGDVQRYLKNKNK